MAKKWSQKTVCEWQRQLKNKIKTLQKGQCKALCSQTRRFLQLKKGHPRNMKAIFGRLGLINEGKCGRYLGVILI